MNLKPVEMQVALPRTVDAGMMQGQAQQKNVQDQLMLSHETMRKLEETRKKSERTDMENEIDDQLDQNKRNSSEGGLRDRERKQDKERKAQHPYKGKHVDISL